MKLRTLLRRIILVLGILTALGASAQKVPVYVDFGGLTLGPTNHPAFLAAVQAHFNAAGIGQGDDPGVVFLDSTNTAPLAAPPFLINATARVTFVCDPSIFAYGRAFPTNRSAVINLYAYVLMDFPGASNEVRRTGALAETVAHEVGHLLDTIHDCGNGGGAKEEVVPGEVTVTNYVACAGPATLMTLGTCVSNSFRGLSLRAFSAESVADMKNCIAGLAATPPLLCTKFVTSGQPDGDEDGFLRAVEGHRSQMPLVRGAVPLRQEDENITLNYDVVSGSGQLFEFGWLARSNQFVSLTGAKTNQHGTIETAGGTGMLFALRGRPWTAFAGQVFAHKDFATVTFSGRTNTPANAATFGIRTNYYSQATLTFTVSNTTFVVGLDAGAWSGDNGFYQVNSAAQPEPPTTTLVSRGGVWRYLANGTDPGPNWMTTGFNDAVWASGPAELGFGDNPTTVINNSPSVNRYITYYFRRSFTVANAAAYSNLLVRLQRDDGAVVYLNGVEVWRSGMPGGPIVTNTFALASIDNAAESVFFETNSVFAAQQLSNGVNVVAVEVHQATTSASEDLSFDLELIGNAPPENARPVVFLSSPANNTTFETGQNIVLSVSGGDAVDPDGAITRVEFFGGETFDAVDTTAPFSVVWSNAPPRSYSIIVLVYDDAGAATVSTAPVDIVVLPNRPPDVFINTPVDGRTYYATGGTVSVTFAATAWDTLPSGQLVNPASVEFYTNGVLTATDTTAPYSTTVTVSLSQVGSYTLRAVAVDSLGARGTSAPVMVSVTSAPPAAVTLVNTGQVWRYFLSAFLQDTDTNWNQLSYVEPNFLWSSCTAPLNRSNSCGGALCSCDAHYFRLPFVLSSTNGISALQLRILHDDGAIAYLNGVEVFRNNLAAGPVNSSTRATNELDAMWFTNSVSSSLLRTGTNLLAIETHEGPNGFDDLLLDAEIVANPNGSSAPVITLQPLTGTNIVNGTVAFSVGVASSAPLTYQWYDTVLGLLAGRTSALLLFTNAQSSDADRRFYVVASNTSGSVTSSVVALRLRPTLATQPQDLEVAQGAPASFSAGAVGSTNLSYRWQRSGTNIVPAATSSTYTIASTTLGSAGSYRVIVTNAFGAATSSVAALTVVTAPAIVTHPQDATATVFSSATFTVQASGTTPLTYQWQRNGGNLTGAFGPILVLPSVQASDGGTNQYRAIVSNLAGNATSAVARLTVITPPVITRQPVSQRVLPGSTATFDVIATGSDLTYQWYRAPGTALPAATNSALVLSNVTTAQAEYYHVVVANSICPLDSDRAFLEVLEPREMYFPTNRLPPRHSSYSPVDDFHVAYTNGLMIVSNGNHTSFTTNLPPPPPLTPQIHNFGSRIQGNASLFGSSNATFVSAPADVVTLVTNLGVVNGRTRYSNQMVSLSATNGGLPNGFALRVAPNKISAGSTTIRPAFGGFLIASEFTLCTEATDNGGQSWAPGLAPVHVELSRLSDEYVFGSSNLPPLKSHYVSPEQYHASWAAGIVISNIIHSGFDLSPPPPTLFESATHSFNSRADFDLSMNNGATFMHVSTTNRTTVRLTHDRDTATNAHIETEMLQLDITGGGLPAGVKVRKDPDRAASGETTIRSTSEGPAISSYFDIPLQLSMDNGATWSSANRPVRVEMLGEPKLTITRNGPNVELSWLALSDGCALEAAASLAPPIPWRAASAVPVIQGDRFVATLPVSGTMKYFRLETSIWPPPLPAASVTVEVVPDIGALKKVNVTVPGPCRVTAVVRSSMGNQLGQASGGPSGGEETVIMVGGIALENGDTLSITVDCPCFQHEEREYVFQNGQFVEVF